MRDKFVNNTRGRSPWAALYSHSALSQGPYRAQWSGMQFQQLDLEKINGSVMCWCNPKVPLDQWWKIMRCKEPTIIPGRQHAWYNKHFPLFWSIVHNFFHKPNFLNEFGLVAKNWRRWIQWYLIWHNWPLHFKWAMDNKRRIKETHYAWVLGYYKRIQTPHYIYVSYCDLVYLLLCFDTLCWQHFQALLWTYKLVEPYFIRDP